MRHLSNAVSQASLYLKDEHDLHQKSLELVQLLSKGRASLPFQPAAATAAVVRVPLAAAARRQRIVAAAEPRPVAMPGGRCERGKEVINKQLSSLRRKSGCELG